MKDFTLGEWIATRPGNYSLHHELEAELMVMLRELHEFCIKHDVPAVISCLSYCDPDKHTIIGSSHLVDLETTVPEMLIMHVLSREGLLGGVAKIDAIIESTPERYSTPTLRLVKSDE